MNDAVKPKRNYVSRRRGEQAADTRASIIVAARRHFIDAGWQGTTIAAVARTAGVSSETVYAVFGNKQALLRAVIEQAVRRTAPDVPLLDQAGPQAVAAAADQPALIALFARDIASVLDNVAGLMSVIRTAANLDADLAEMYRDLHAGRRRNLASVARALLEKGPLRDGMDAEAATALLWRLASPELFLLMTGIEQVSAPDYVDWLERTLISTMLPN